MHDFCLTFPYGMMLMLGGVVGYVKKGSTASLGGGAGAGLLLIVAAYFSLKAFQNRKKSYLALIVQIFSAVLITWVMGQRYMQTSKIMPSGIVAAISGLMSGFYVYKIASGGNQIPPSKAE